MEIRVKFWASAVIEVPEGVDPDDFINTADGWNTAFDEAAMNGFEMEWEEW